MKILTLQLVPQSKQLMDKTEYGVKQRVRQAISPFYRKIPSLLLSRLDSHVILSLVTLLYMLRGIDIT